MPFATFIDASKSQDVLEKISTKTGVNIKDNFIEKLYEGSTIVVGSLSTGSAAQAQSVQSSLGNTITGYSILSSSSSVMYNDQVYVPPTPEAAKDTTNVGLIVGLVVGLTALVVIVILLIWFFKCRNQDNVSLRKENSSSIQLK